jgi:hypothetical protein
MPHNFTSLRYSLEKLLEAEYFVARQIEADGIEFQFVLNAYLSAIRSVTFFLQSNMAAVQGFEDWYEQQKAQMRADPAMRFFLELRNISQKQGPVSYIGGGIGHGWTYRFVSQLVIVPDELKGRDVAECCAEHLAKISQVVLSCFKHFPFASCPGRAFTVEGMAALSFDMSDVEVAVGLPPGYVGDVDIPVEEKLRLLRKEVEPLDVPELERLAAGNFASRGEPLQLRYSSGRDLVDDIARLVENGEQPSKTTFLKAILQRIDGQITDTEKK